MRPVRNCLTFIYCQSNNNKQQNKRSANRSMWHYRLILDKLAPSFQAVLSRANSGTCVRALVSPTSCCLFSCCFTFALQWTQRGIKIMLPPRPPRCYSTTSVCLVSLYGFLSSTSVKNAVSTHLCCNNNVIDIDSCCERCSCIRYVSYCLTL